MPWEDDLDTQLPPGSRQPPNFKTFDFFDEITGVATSAKTLDTTTAAKPANPRQVYSSLKGNIDAASNFIESGLKGLAEPRKGVWIHPEATFDRDLYDHTLTTQRYEQWVGSTLERFGYKTRRALFKDMKKCSIESKEGQITIRPSHHEKPEVWSGKGISESLYVTVPSQSHPADIGAALRLAFTRYM